jgi:hypothetical protein
VVRAATGTRIGQGKHDLMNKQLLNLVLILSVSPLFAANNDLEKVIYTDYGDTSFQAKCPMDLLAKNPKVRFDVETNVDRLDLGWKGEYDQKLATLVDSKITYKVFKDNFFVISGLQGDRVFYLKEIPKKISNTMMFGSLEMSFPLADKATWDPILTVCANSLKSSTLTTNFPPKIPSSALTNEKWGMELDSIHVYLKQEEIVSMLAHRFNWGEKEEEVLTDLFNSPVIRTWGGNWSNVLEDRAENAGTQEERDKAQKELDDTEEGYRKETEKEVKNQNVYVKKLRIILNGRDEDFFEWYFEESIIDGEGWTPKLENFNQPPIDAVMTFRGKHVLCNEQAVITDILKKIENNPEYKLYKWEKNLLIVDEKRIGEYFDLWNKMINDRILIFYKSTKASQKMRGVDEATPDELNRLQDEITELTQKMDLLMKSNLTSQ